MSHAEVRQATDRLLDELEKVIVGKRPVLSLIVNAMLANGHILLEDVPGVAKTAIARSLAQAAGMRFARVQFTPDLIPADITGSTVLTSATSAPEFRPGPVFANLVLGDEINRAPPKTQSALLEAMEERQVTADAATRELPTPFIVIGTQNPIEQEGTYPLPEAQLDRFLIRTGIGYPGRDNEVDLILRRAGRGTDQAKLQQVLTANDVVALQQWVEQVHVSTPVARYIVDVVEATRQSPRTEAGASPRGSLALLKLSRARAAMNGRSHVLPDDVKAIAIPCLAHRILLQPDQWVRGVRAEQVVEEVVAQVPAPAAVEPHDQVRTAAAQPQPAASPQPMAGNGFPVDGQTQPPPPSEYTRPATPPMPPGVPMTPSRPGGQPPPPNSPR